MPDTKITALTAIGANPIIPATFPIPMVDLTDTSMAASGTTKKVTVNQILGAGGTATLASATISGDLTAARLIVTGGTIPTNGLWLPTTNTLEFAANSLAQYRIAPLGVFTWYDGAGGTRMTLNSTGLGVGVVSPSTKLDVLGSGDSELRLRAASDAALIFSETTANKNWKIKPSGGDLYFQYSATAYNSGYSSLMSLTAAGNVGIGVTPSAWFSNYKALQVNGTASVSGFSSGSNQNTRIANNWFSNAAGTDTYIQSNFATAYQQNQGVHSWLTAPSGTAGNAITFTQAMTLDASGNWIIGGTSQISSSRASITNAGGDQLAINATNTSTGQSAIKFCNAGTAQAFVWWDKSDSRFYVQNSSGGVYLASTATSWTSNSDERLKDIIEPISNAVSKVGSLRAIIGKYKNDETNTRRSFLIAQDVQAVLPEAVDASNPDKLGVAYTDVIPLLVAAIKELTARVQTLEAK